MDTHNCKLSSVMFFKESRSRCRKGREVNQGNHIHIHDDREHDTTDIIQMSGTPRLLVQASSLLSIHGETAR